MIFRARFHLQFLLGLVALLWLSACATSSLPPRSLGQLSASEQREAQKEYEKLLGLSASGQAAKTLENAYGVLDRYPGFQHEDHILLLGGRAAYQMGDDSAARVLFGKLISGYPQSRYRPPALWELARMEDKGHRWLDAAEAYARYLDRPDDTQKEKEAWSRLQQVIDTNLDVDELGRLEESIPGGVAVSTVAFSRAAKSYEKGDSPKEAGRLLESFLLHYPDSPKREAAENMLAELRGKGEYEPRSGLNLAFGDRIGMLCPLTGEYAALGQAMYDGALIALEEHNRRSGDSLKLVAMDTKGDGVQTVLATRSLIEKEGVLAVVGSLLSPTTIAAAVVCQERKVPLVSPTATQENIHLIGSEIFQTNLTGEFETKLVAWASVRLLLRRRLAILYPQTAEGRHAAEIFAREAESLGAKIVASEPFERGMTDFKDPMQRIRNAGPEALFVPAGPSSMRLIAPQLTFYHLDLQLLGPSTWNNPRLAREMGEALDRAIFPSETALMPAGESERFRQLWTRRHGGDEADPFAMKTWFATLRVLQAVHDGARSRGELTKLLTAHMEHAVSGESVQDGVTALRVLENGEVEAFPEEIVRPVLPVEEGSPAQPPLGGE